MFLDLRRNIWRNIGLAILICSIAAPITAAELRAIDLRRAAARGIRVIEGKHLTLLTDLPASAEVDELPAAFDAAIPHWCDYYGIDPKQCANWQVRGYLMRDKAPFEAAELLPADLPDFPNGYALRGEFYFHNQTSPYYRRHLMLHEGTHLFQFDVARIKSEQWYTEGIAEHFGTHIWKEGRLTMRVLPDDPQAVSKWGRIELVQQDLNRGKGLTLSEVLKLHTTAFKQNESYAWTWHLAVLLDSHPRYRDRFRKLQRAALGGDLTPGWQRAFETDRQFLADDLAIFSRDAVYGYDWEKTQVEFGADHAWPAENKPFKLTVSSERGWQNTGLRLIAGAKYIIFARGQALLKQEPKPWPVEPNGVTIRYHHGQPLGMLLAAVRDESSAAKAEEVKNVAQPEAIKPKESAISFSDPLAVGLVNEFTAPRNGRLFLKINDSAAELDDNKGSFEVAVVKVP